MKKILLDIPFALTIQDNIPDRSFTLDFWGTVR